MHPEAYDGFKWALERSRLDTTAPLRVLDVGGQNVNGTVHDLLSYCEVKTLDLENADILADATTWEPTELFDVVIATEVFEHVEDWPAVIRMMRKALDPVGPGIFLTTVASTHRQPHGATGDPDPALGEWYENVDPGQLGDVLAHYFGQHETRYLYPPGDVYAWAAVEPLLDITVVIPTVPDRSKFLKHAINSVDLQSFPSKLITVPDENREGPALVRNRGIEQVRTGWVAFLDDDDWMHPNHLDVLARAALDSGADVVWPWFEVDGGTDPFPQHRGRQWDPTDPHQIPITVLIRKEALDAVGGFRVIGEGPVDGEGHRAGEDFDLWLRLSEAGFVFHHVPDVTWTWRHWRGNSSGLPSRIDWNAVR